MKYFVLILLILLPSVTFASKEQQLIYLQHNALRNEKIQNGNFRIYTDRWLIQDAQNWANYLAKNYKQQHKNISPHSNVFQNKLHNFYKEEQWENIARWSRKMDLDRAFILWANEEQYYDINRNKCSGICGHYTQIVWEKSKFVWCAKSRSEHWYWEWVVCRYSPGWNYVNEVPYNNQSKYSNQIYKNILISIEQINKISKNWKKVNRKIERMFIKFNKEKDKEKLILLDKRVSELYNKLIKKKKLSLNEHIIIQIYYRLQLELYWK